MKHLKLIIILIAGLLGSPAMADGDAVDETKDAQPDGFVTVNVTRGEVKFRGWDKHAVRLVGTLDENMKGLVFERDDEEVRIKIDVKEREFGWFNDSESSDLTIYVPEASTIDFRGVSTDVDVRGVTNAIEVGVVSGDLYLEGSTSRVSVQTVSGDVELRDSEGRVRIKTVSGEIESFRTIGDAQYSSVSGNILVEDGGTEMQVESVSGDIEVNNESVKRIGGHSVSGDIDINVLSVEASIIEFDSVSGSIRLRLNDDVNAQFDIETGSGSIRNRISNHMPKMSKYQQEETLRFSLGDGDGQGQVSITTRSGDITLGRR